MTRPIACTVATSDSGGGAGIQADLKTFAANGAYGVSVLVALTAQNTVAVTAVEPLPTEFVAAQIEALDQDLRPAAVKTGMLYSADLIREVVAQLSRRDWGPLVVDPVMVAKSGATLLQADAVRLMRERLIPLATVLTPNWPEASALTGLPVTDGAEAQSAAHALTELGVPWVVVKGGHAPGPPVDVVVHDGSVTQLEAERIDSRHTHGTGCTFSAAITANLARGDAPLDAVRAAKAYELRCLARAPGLGAGHGPLEHFPGREPGPTPARRPD